MPSSPRFSIALNTPRPRGMRVVEVFSPKLGRRLQCYGNHGLDQWICLEADPEVITFCERPTYMEWNGSKRVVDFWVQRNDQEMFLVIEDARHAPNTSKADMVLPVEHIPMAEFAAQRMWIDNWERMLPTIISCRELMTPQLTKLILKKVGQPTILGHIEQEFAVGDPSLVRATVFHLLQKGRLRAPQLKTTPLGFTTCFDSHSETS